MMTFNYIKLRKKNNLKLYNFLNYILNIMLFIATIKKSHKSWVIIYYNIIWFIAN